MGLIGLGLLSIKPEQPLGDCRGAAPAGLRLASARMRDVADPALYPEFDLSSDWLERACERDAAAVEDLRRRVAQHPYFLDRDTAVLSSLLDEWAIPEYRREEWLCLAVEMNLNHETLLDAALGHSRENDPPFPGLSPDQQRALQAFLAEGDALSAWAHRDKAEAFREEARTMWRLASGLDDPVFIERLFQVRLPTREADGHADPRP